MIGFKRRREGSLTATPSVSNSNVLRPSSIARSSPVSQSQQERYFQQQPVKRVSLCLPRSQLSSRSTSSPHRQVRGLPRLQSTTPSERDIRPESAAAIVEREDADSLHEVIMCVDMRDRGTVGCCYYVARDQKLFVMADVTYGGIEVIDTLKLQIQPTVVILSTRVDEIVETCFDPEGRSRGADGDQFALPYIIEFRPSPEFSYESGKNKLTNLGLSSEGGREVSFVTPGYDDAYETYGEGNEAGFTGRQGKFLRLSAWIDMESRLTVGCAGALLAYVGRRKAVEYLPNDTAASTFGISSIEMFSLQGTMFINADTLASLQIVQSESSPNTHSQGPTKMASGSKEGLSVYGLFHHLARTPQGKSLLRLYFLRPSLDMAVINERLDTASIFLRPENSSPMNSIMKSLGQIKNMRTVMVHLRKGVSNGLSKSGGIKSGIWSTLRSFAFYTLQIRNAVMEVVGLETIAIGVKVLESFDTHEIAMIGRAISEKVDFTSSAEMHRTVIKSGIDLELDGMKRHYDGLEDLLNHTSREIASTVPAVYDLDLNVIFYPQIGFLIAIPNNPATGRGDYEGGEAEDQRWDRIFSTALTVYYKDNRMRTLDDDVGDIYAVICDKEIEIVHELGQQVLAREEMLNTASDICGELDSLLALAQGARVYKFCRPRITEKNIIHIKGGRHPLQELTVPSYVPNDTFLVGGPSGRLHTPAHSSSNERPANTCQERSDSEDLEGPSMLMMTGPNYSGKSVYLKQIALVVYMSHVGCFVPADRAIIGLTDKILTRIASRETVSRFQSAFMIDLQQVALAMTQASHRSLVIIDEFGKGTESSDGAGLACGVFEYFLGLGEDRPKVLGATHFHEIFENGFLRQRNSLRFGYLEVRLDREAEDVEDQIIYLYNFRSGRTTTSYGSCCAALNGVDASVVDRANELVELSAKGEDLVVACATMSPQEKEDLREAEDTAREFLARDFRQMASGNDQIDALQDLRNVLEILVEPTGSVE